MHFLAGMFLWGFSGFFLTTLVVFLYEHWRPVSFGTKDEIDAMNHAIAKIALTGAALGVLFFLMRWYSTFYMKPTMDGMGVFY